MSFDTISSSLENGLKTTNEVIVEEHDDSEDSSIDSLSSDNERRDHLNINISPEYWNIQKLIKYMKTGNQTATIIALCCLKDFDLTNEVHQLAIQETGGLEVLINLLETNDVKCKLGALSVLTKISQNHDIRYWITDLGGINLLVKNLTDPTKDLQILVAETIYNVAEIRKARRQIRKFNGIPKLIDLLDIDDYYLKTPNEQLGNDFRSVELVKASVKALWSISKSRKNIIVMMKSGAVPLLTKLLRSIHKDIIIPTAGTIAQCSHCRHYQLAIQTEGMIKDIVRHLIADNTNPELKKYCAEILYRCCDDSVSRNLVRQAGGLDPLIQMIKDEKTHEDKDLITAITGAIWKTAITPENVERYDQLRTVEILVKILEHPDEDERVLSNVVGALSECLKFKHNCEILRKSNGLNYIINLLNYTYPPLLENVPMILRQCAEDPESMAIIEELDGIRLIWSLLKQESPNVQANAAWSLVSCIHYSKNSGELVRSFVGGLELIVNLLKSTDEHVLSCICATISEIAKDNENLSIITDYGVVPLLVNLIGTENNKLRQYLASAIAFCCGWGSNCKNFGRLGVIPPLVNYMESNNTKVHRSTALALFKLSNNAYNCITMHKSGVVQFLLKAIGSTDWNLQESAAGCLANIRKLALDIETGNIT